MGELPNSDFLAACQAISPLVFQRERGDDKSPVSLHRPYALVGRDPEADINLEPSSVSARKFCVPPETYLQVIGGRLLCVDLRRYTRNDPSLGPRKAWLRVGESLKLEGAKVRLISGLPEKPLAVPKERLASISIQEPGGMKWVVSQPLTVIGSAAESHVRLSNPNVARFHTSLVNEPGGVWVVSLSDSSSASRNGTTPFIRRGERVALSIANINLEIEVSAAGSVGLAPVSLTAAPVPLPNATTGLLPEHVMAMQQQMFSQFQSTIDKLIQTFGTVQRDQMELLRREMDRIDRLDREIGALRTERMRLGDSNIPASPKVERLPLSPPAPIPNPTRPLVLPPATTDSASTPAPSSPPQHNQNVHAWLDQRVASLQQERESVWAKIAGFFTKMPSES